MIKPIVDRLRQGLVSHYPLLYLITADEERVETLLARLSIEHYGDERPVVTWTVARGFHPRQEEHSEPKSTIEALHFVVSSKNDSFYLFKDLPALFDDQTLVRGVRDLYEGMTDRNTYVFLSYHRLRIPDALKNQFFIADIGTPTEVDIYDFLKESASAGDLVKVINKDWLFRCATAMKGFEFGEIRRLFLNIVRENKFVIGDALELIYREKAARLLKEAGLIYVAKTTPIDRIGGLHNLKDWVTSRAALFGTQAYEADMPLPRGILFMGVSGCGKSMAAKVIAGAWSLPLVRLDMNLIMSGALGAPGFVFDDALKVTENVAPVVLWIDEIENSFGRDISLNVASSNNTIFSAFLTWMQEKPATVFVVATANRIDSLPAEIMRKGRFDQLFFVDLPSDDERKEIWQIHLTNHGVDTKPFNLELLTVASLGWTGAEIEEAVRSARIRAFQEKRTLNQDDILWSTSRIVPLSKTMAEQIRHLRDWSKDRATPASRN